MKKSLKNTFVSEEQTPVYFDERQILITGKGYKYAFFTMFGLAILMLLWETFELPAFATPGALLYLTLLLGAFINAAYCIWNGAYFGVNSNKKRVLFPTVALAIVTTLSGIDRFREGDVIVDGLITWNILPLSVGIFSILLLSVVGLKTRKDRKDEDA